MKRLLAILALLAVMLCWPYAAVAGFTENPTMDSQQGTEVQNPTCPPSDIDQDLQDTHGDPHDLGGGFRGADPDTDATTDADWLSAFWDLIQQLV